MTTDAEVFQRALAFEMDAYKTAMIAELRRSNAILDVFTRSPEWQEWARRREEWRASLPPARRARPSLFRACAADALDRLPGVNDAAADRWSD